MSRGARTDVAGSGLAVAPGAVAPVGVRVGAFTIDVVAAATVAAVAFAAARVATGSGSEPGLTALIVADGAALAFGIGQWVAEATTGATLGSALLRIRTVSATTGRPAGLARILLRQLVIGLGSLACGVGAWVVAASGAWDKGVAQRGWHDKAAGTLVLRADAVRGAVPVDVAGSYASAVARVVGPASPPAARRDRGDRTPGVSAVRVVLPDAASTVHAAADPAAAHATAPADQGAPARIDAAATGSLGRSATAAPSHPAGPPGALDLARPAAPFAPAAAAGPLDPAAAAGPLDPGATAGPRHSGAHAAPVVERGPAAPAPRPDDVAADPVITVPAFPVAALRPDDAADVPNPYTGMTPVVPPPGPGLIDGPPGFPSHRIAPAAPAARSADLGDLEHTRLRAIDGERAAPATPPTPAALRLAFDTGEVVDVTGDGLVGRNPAPHPGTTHLVAIDDPDRSVSKVHLAFGPDGAGQLWVLDRGSTNGTVLVRPDGTRATLPPGARATIGAGWAVRFGERTARVEPR